MFRLGPFPVSHVAPIVGFADRLLYAQMPQIIITFKCMRVPSAPSQMLVKRLRKHMATIYDVSFDGAGRMLQGYTYATT